MDSGHLRLTEWSPRSDSRAPMDGAPTFSRVVAQLGAMRRVVRAMGARMPVGGSERERLERAAERTVDALESSPGTGSRNVGWMRHAPRAHGQPGRHVVSRLGMCGA